MIAALLERDPAPITLTQPTSPPALDRVVRTCLAKDPDERFQTVHDVKLQLKWIVEGAASSATQAGTATAPIAMGKFRASVLAAAALVFALAGLVLGIAYLHHPANDALSVRSSILPPANASFVNGLAPSGYALSPDGTRLVFSAQSAEGKTSLWMRSLNSITPQELAGTKTAASRSGPLTACGLASLPIRS